MNHCFRFFACFSLCLASGISTLHAMCPEQEQIVNQKVADLDEALTRAMFSKNDDLLKAKLNEARNLARWQYPLQVSKSLDVATTIHGNVEAFEALLDVSGLSITPDFVKNAIKRDRTDLLDIFIKRNLINPQETFFTSLIPENIAKALKSQRIDVVQRYKKGDLVDTKDTPLIYAARLKKIEILEQLAPLYSEQELSKAYSLFKEKTAYIDSDDVDSDDELCEEKLNEPSSSQKAPDTYTIYVDKKVVATGSTVPVTVKGESHPLPEITKTTSHYSWLHIGVGSALVGSVVVIASGLYLKIKEAALRRLPAKKT